MEDGRAKMNKLEILYEDNHIIVVYKYPGMLSQSDNTKDLDMLSLINIYLNNQPMIYNIFFVFYLFSFF